MRIKVVIKTSETCDLIPHKGIIKVSGSCDFCLRIITRRVHNVNPPAEISQNPHKTYNKGCKSRRDMV